eukprot:1733123-Rhodomonas_salina.1
MAAESWKSSRPRAHHQAAAFVRPWPGASSIVAHTEVESAQRERFRRRRRTAQQSILAAPPEAGDVSPPEISSWVWSGGIAWKFARRGGAWSSSTAGLLAAGGFC